MQIHFHSFQAAAISGRAAVLAAVFHVNFCDSQGPIVQHLRMKIVFNNKVSY